VLELLEWIDVCMVASIFSELQFWIKMWPIQGGADSP
jgi:hypothetical protein